MIKIQAKYLYIIFFFIIPAVIMGINEKYLYSALLLGAVIVISILEKRKDLVDKYF